MRRLLSSILSESTLHVLNCLHVNERDNRRSKGLTEIALASLGYSDTIIFRPAFLVSAERGHKNTGEAIVAYVVDAAYRISANLIKI